MTRPEFDTWIEQHYTELLKVARRRVNSDDDAADVLHQAVASAISTGAYEKTGGIGAWPWAVSQVRGFATAARRTNARQGELKRAKKILHRAGSSLGRTSPNPTE